MLRRLKRYKHANMTCSVAKHKTDARFAERDALPDYISTHDEVINAAFARASLPLLLMPGLSVTHLLSLSLTHSL